MLEVSCQILTYNSGATLRTCLESVKQCSEILVIDGGSTDDTLEIAKEFGARILAQPQEGPLEDFSAARNIGLHFATKEWILALDSDEWASKELMEEIEKIVRHPEGSSTDGSRRPACHPEGPERSGGRLEGRLQTPHHDSAGSSRRTAFAVPRKYILEDGTIVQHASTYPNSRLYFFHRDAIEEWIKPVHERPRLTPNTRISKLSGASLAPLGTIEDYKSKNRKYLEIEKDKSAGKGLFHWFTNRFLRFLRSRISATLRILWIWLIPRRGKRLPLRHEMVRYWYAWRLLLVTFPSKS